MIMLLIGVFQTVTTISAATAGLNNNRNSFGKGDTIVTTIALAHSGNPVTVDAYLILVLPDQTPVFFEYNNGLVPHVASSDPSTWIRLISNVPLTNGFDTGPLSIFEYTTTGSEQPGLYQWVFAIAPAGTLNLLDLKAVSFFVSPGQVGTLLGTWNVTTSIPTLGASGTSSVQIVDGSPGVISLSANGYSAGYTSSFSATGLLTLQGGISWTMTADIFGTQVQGNGFIDPNGNISGTINVTVVGPFIQAITNISGTISGGIINTTEIVHYTDGTSGLEYLTGVRQ